MYYKKELAAKLGQFGEQYVADYLKGQGYIIVKRNWKDRYGEIDIIAENDENVVFVEVKTRTIGAMVSGIEAVDIGKMRRTRNAAEMFMKRMNTTLKPRIDVAEVIVTNFADGERKCSLNYIKSAF